MPSNTRAEQQAADQKLETGINQFLTSPITVGGKPYTAPDLDTVIQGRIAARNATDAAKAAYHGAVSAEAAAISGSKVLLEQTKAVLLVMFASAPQTLAAMGLSARKTSTRTVEAKAGAIEKAEATRKARNTMGPKARLKVTGVTSGTAAVTQAPSASAPTPVTVAPIATGKAAT